MKRKKILKEGVQIPYRLDDFKPGDRLHIIGDYDDVSFDNFATVIGTSNDIDSPYSDDAAILVHLDSPNQISGALHDSDTGIPEIKKKCRHNCWWLWMYQFNPEYNYENYRVNYDENRVIKLNDNLPDAYDVISSLYESEDLDWAMNMASDISKNIITPGQYYRINGKIAYQPFDDTIDLYIKAVDNGVIVYDIISIGNITWSAKDEKVSLGTASKLVNDNYWMPISKEKSLFNKKRMDESEDFDWAMDMAKNIDDSQIKLLEIPKKRNGYYNIILLDKPGIAYQTIANIVDYINEKTSWKSTLSSGDIKDIYNNYTRKGFSYINLTPNNLVSYGSSEDTFAYLYDMDFSDPSVKIIRPY